MRWYLTKLISVGHERNVSPSLYVSLCIQTYKSLNIVLLHSPLTTLPPPDRLYKLSLLAHNSKYSPINQEYFFGVKHFYHIYPTFQANILSTDNVLLVLPAIRKHLSFASDPNYVVTITCVCVSVCVCVCVCVVF